MSVPSPLSTGGSGTAYEYQVGAMFLSYLLTRNPANIFPDHPVHKVSFQTRHDGWNTDDILVTCLSDMHEQHKIAIQAKRKFAIGSSSNCLNTFQGFWKDFHATDRFNPDKDVFVLATIHSTKSLDAFEKLLNCARDSQNAKEFKSRLKISGFIPKKANEHYKKIQSIVKKTDISSDVTEENLWRFLKSIHVLFLNFESTSMTDIKNILSRSADKMDVADATWSKMVEIAANSAGVARTFTYWGLPKNLRERHQPDWGIIKPLKGHSKIILDGIRSTIAGTITLPRTETIAKVTKAMAENRVVALTGPAGAGKSVLARKIIEQKSNDFLCLSFRAEEFADAHLDRVLPGSISGEVFDAVIGSQDQVLIHLESFERLFESANCDAFLDLVTIVERHPKVSLLLTCRDNEINTTIETFFDRDPLKCHAVTVPPLNAKEMKQVGEAVLPLKTILSSSKPRHLLRIPYVLDMAANMNWPDNQDIPSTIKTFREKWWRDTVRKGGNTSGLASRRGLALMELATRRARELRPSVKTDKIDSDALHALFRDGLITLDDTGLAAPTHDIIEDWAIMKRVESLVAGHEWQVLPISKDIGPYHVIRRVFREWLKEELDIDAKKAYRFVLSVCQNNSLPQYFTDEVLVSLLLSDSAPKIISHEKDLILKDDASLLIRLVRLACVACTKFDNPSSDHPTDTSRFFVPDGKVWPILLNIVHDNLDCLLPKYYYEILELLEVWVQGARISAVPDGAIPAISVAYNLFAKNQKARRNDKILRRIFNIIASVPCADSNFFQKLVEQATLESGWNNNTYHEFRQILIHPSGFAVCRDLPKVMAKFILSLRFPSDSDSSILEPGAYFYSESKFGLRKAAKSNFNHFSAFCGPFLSLLRQHPGTGISLVLDLVNDAGEWYGNHEEVEIPHIEIAIPGHGKVTQWADDTLWRAYRGTSDVPHVIMCALMALEYWLLEICKGRQDMEPWLLKILSEGQSVMTTAVVASVCTAYPNIGDTVTLALLGSQDCIDLDKIRKEKEGYAPTVSYAAINSWEKHYDDERKRSNALPHRQYDLETVAHRPQHENDKMTSIEDGNCQQTAIPNADKTYADTSNSSGSETEKNLQNGTAFSLYDWGLIRWKQDSDDENAISWRQALTLAQDDAKSDAKSDRGYPIRNGPPVVAAVCVRDHWNEMSNDEHKWCINTIITEIGQYSDVNDAVVYLAGRSMDSDSISARVLPKILARYPHNKKILKAVAKSLTHKSPAVCRNAARGVADYLEPNHHNLTLRCVRTVATLSNLSGNIKQQHPKKRMGPSSNGSQKVLTPLEFARLTFLEEPIDIEKELEGLDIKSQLGTDAAMSIILMLGRTPDLPITNKFITCMVQEVVNTFTTGYQAGYIILGDNFREKIMNALAEISLASPKGLHYCQPFLDAVDKYPDEAALFVEQLILCSDESATRSFWILWQAFADQILKAPWIHTLPNNNSVGADLTLRMMLINVNWLIGPRYHKHLLNDKKEYVSEFVESLPASPHVLAVFLDYLYTYRERSQAVSLPALAHHLQTVKYQELPRNRNAIRLLEYILRRYINRKPAIKTDPALRKDILLILDWLVDAGSTISYNMRDVFTTLSADDR